MKRILLTGLIILLFLVAFGIVITINTRKLNHYYDKTAEIRQDDSANLTVKDIWLNRGYLFLNDSLFIRGSQIEEPNLQLIEIYKLQLPFNLKKALQNDTIWIMDQKEIYFFVFQRE